MKAKTLCFLLIILYSTYIGQAQDKWSADVVKLDSVDRDSRAYAKLIVNICWQISDLSPDSSLYYGDLGLKWTNEHHDDSIKSRALLGISAAISRQGKHAQSIESSLEALKIAENIGDTTSIYDAYTNIGIDKYYLGEIESSLVYFKQSAEVVQHYRPETFKSKHQYANALMNVALTESDLDNTEGEVKTYYEVARLFHELDEKRNYGLTLFNLGKAYQRLEKRDSVAKYFEESLQIFRKHKWTSAESDVLTNWSEMLFNEKDYVHAMALTKESLELANKTKNTLQERFAYGLLHKIYAALGEFELAYKNELTYRGLVDSLREIDKQQYVDELLAKYDIEKKEQQIAQLEQENLIQELEAQRQKQLKTFLFVGAVLLLLAIGLLYSRYRSKNKTNAILDAKNQELAKLNQTKDRLFSIISHDLKSPLSSFHTITKSLSDNWEALEKEQLKDFVITLRDSSADVKNMMDNLLKWALAQTDQLSYRPSQVDSQQIVERVIKELSAVTSLKNIPIELDVKGVEHIKADKDFLQIVIRNLLSNALKFSEMNSKIEVMVEENEEAQVISIQDHGVGMDQSQVDQLFAGSIVAQDIQNSTEKGTGLGLVLCKELVERMGGKISAQSEKGKGTIFKFTLPRAA